MATYTSSYPKFKFFGVIFLLLALIVSVLTELDDDYDSVNYIPIESRETENEFEEVDDSEISTSTDSSQDFLTESDSDAAPLEKPSDFYSFSVHDTHGDLISLERYRGKVSLSNVLTILCIV